MLTLSDGGQHRLQPAMQPLNQQWPVQLTLSWLRDACAKPALADWSACKNKKRLVGLIHSGT